MADTEEATIPIPVVVLLLLVALGLAGGLKPDSTTNRRGVFEITYEWGLINGGVSHTITRNNAVMVSKPRILRESSKATYRIPGKENDRVVATMKGIRDFDASSTSYMFVSIIFHPDGAFPTLPAFSRDATPTQSGVIARWP